MSIGAMGFLAPYLGYMLFAHYGLAWPWPQAQIAGVSLSTTSVAVVYAVMIETGFNRKRDRQDHSRGLLRQRSRHGAGTRAGLRQL
jgi:Kef-type K+ transport system membrane component KefB